MGNGFVGWFSRSYRGVIIGLVAIMAAAMVLLAVQHVNASRPAAGAVPAPVPTFESTKPPLVTIIGDSYTAGSPENTGPKTLWPVLAREELGFRFQNLAVGGSGYVNLGLDGKPFLAQTGRISSDSDLVLVYGSRNDQPTTDPTVEQQAATALYQAIKDKAPNAQVVVIGPSYVENPAPAGGVSNADAIRKAAAAAGASYTDAIDWFHGTPGSYIGGDGIHPTDEGHKYLAKKIEPIIKDALG